ncbi:hypothetical protein [Arthrobacter bambusae]|uniref:Uncharacterized protein n=1 Tax=Arthrobacter bambusae TaxID=1338426 RepID=A0AAW8DH75_9MICC|nr:hypothetical protein [Arthrobacter bambusae]MDP9904599.1 hypothetical protein [Arthrobacter bambusae]MDQ0129415.1 hypothetical protein [Arthrobacter bambusae]MDQ0180972.1 hypothetical protein [Arthrobacter bambusae]
MSSVAILQETLPFDFETEIRVDSDALAYVPQTYTEQSRQADVALCKSYFFRWAGAFGRLPQASGDAYGSDQPAAKPITFEEFKAAARRLAL